MIQYYSRDISKVLGHNYSTEQEGLLRKQYMLGIGQSRRNCSRVHWYNMYQQCTLQYQISQVDSNPNNCKFEGELERFGFHNMPKVQYQHHSRAQLCSFDQRLN